APLSKRPSVAPPPRLAIPSSAGRASSSSATPRSTRGRIAGGRPCTCSRTSCCRRGRAGASAISSARTCASYWKTSPNISRSWPTGCAACLSKFYNWMCERDDDLVSPVIGVKAPAAENVGERVLDDDELRRLWKACEAIGGREGACIKLLILTGQRRGEISHLRWYPRLTGRPFPLNRSAKENAANRSTTISTAGSPPPPRPWPSVAWTIASPISLRG